MSKIHSIWVIKNGEVKIMKQNDFNLALKNLPDGQYWATVEKVYQKHSNDQRNSVFGIPYRILQQCFMESFGEPVTIDWVHNYCKNPDNNIIPEDYLERIKDEWNNDPKNRLVSKTTGEVSIIPFVCTTTKMKTTDMMAYYKNLQKFIWDYFNVDCPDPDSDFKTL